MSDPVIPLAEYATRRRKLGTALKKAVAVLFAGAHNAHLPEPFRPHPHFEYLTGIVDEPGAVLVLDPGNPVASRRELLFLRPLNPEVERWDGYRLEVGSDLRTRTGFQAVFRTTTLPRFLTAAAHRAGTVACVHPIAQYNQPVSPDLEIFRRLSERIPSLVITDRTAELARMRSEKSRAEIAMIQRAVNVTQCGFEQVMRTMRPGQNEFDVQEELEHAYRTNGSRGPAFGSIVGSGINSTVLHYHDNARTIEDGDLVCIDSGAGIGGYGADITRTIPASGRFTKRQHEVYTVVLTAMNAAIKAVKPGVTMAAVDKAARLVITKAGFGDAFIHGVGHHLGLETHDIDPGRPLTEGAVVTIEPGIYLPDEAIGIRIEDDVVVTKTGSRNLAAKIPKTIAAIEKLMADSRAAMVR